ncbi:hypothetical protein KA005_30370 [bacterium]|nr:hypothetical protein [bacterium]
MKRNAILLLILSILLSCGAGCTDSGKYAIAAKGSTLGLGGEFTTGITSNVNARVGINMLDLDFEMELDDIEYDLGIDFSSYSALVDWYVFDGSFRLSGGIISMDHELNLDAKLTVDEDIGDNTYTPDEIGTLSGSIEINQVAPYVGIGWGNPLTHSRRWGFTCDFGVAFTDSPDVTLSANGTMSSNPAFRADMEKERKEIEDDLDSYKFYPVIALSLFYRF